MPRYRVIAYGGMDGLLFPDLLIKYSSGYQYPLKVKQGEYIPVEIFDPLDIQKSLLTGSLGSFIKHNAVKLEPTEVELKKLNKIPRKKKQEIVNIPQVIQPTIEVPTQTEQPQVATKEDAGVPAHIDFKDVITIDVFLKLNYFRRLEFIKQCTDKNLLSQLSEKVDSAQIQFQISLRLKEI